MFSVLSDTNPFIQASGVVLMAIAFFFYPWSSANPVKQEGLTYMPLLSLPTVQPMYFHFNEQLELFISFSLITKQILKTTYCFMQ